MITGAFLIMTVEVKKSLLAILKNNLITSDYDKLNCVLEHYKIKENLNYWSMIGGAREQRDVSYSINDCLGSIATVKVDIRNRKTWLFSCFCDSKENHFIDSNGLYAACLTGKITNPEKIKFTFNLNKCKSDNELVIELYRLFRSRLLKPTIAIQNVINELEGDFTLLFVDLEKFKVFAFRRFLPLYIKRSDSMIIFTQSTPKIDQEFPNKGYTILPNRCCITFNMKDFILEDETIIPDFSDGLKHLNSENKLLLSFDFDLDNIIKILDKHNEFTGIYCGTNQPVIETHWEKLKSYVNKFNIDDVVLNYDLYELQCYSLCVNAVRYAIDNNFGTISVNDEELCRVLNEITLNIPIEIKVEVLKS